MTPNIRLPQFPNTPDNFVVFYADYLQCVPDEIRGLGCERPFLLVSSSLENNTDRIKELEMMLGNQVIGKKVGEPV